MKICGNLAVFFCLIFASISFSEVCWKASYGRGVGTIPGECGTFDKSGLLCYPKCRPGYTGVAFVCWQNCPDGFTDTGAHCLKPKAYGRGGGWAIWNEGKCNAENSQGCEKCWAMWYPKCAKNFHAVGCNICSPDCPAGTKDIGVSCQKDTYTRKTITPSCGDKQYDAGLCYNTCSAGYHGIGPVCWGNCPAGMVDCGAMCGTTASECVTSIFDQIASVGSAIAKIASVVATGGAAAGGEIAAEAAEQSAWTVAKETFKNLAKSVAKKIGSEVKDKLKDAVKSELQKMKGVTPQMAETLAHASANPEAFDYKSFLKSFDVFGFAKIVDSFNKKICPVS